MKNIKKKRKNKMARFRHISTKMVLVLDAGTDGTKKITKRVTIGNIREDASPNALWELAEALGKLLEHPVAKVLLYKEEELEREAGDGAADKNGDARNEAGADNSRAAYGGVQNKGVTKNDGAEKDAGDDRGAGEKRAGGGTALLTFASRGNGSIQPASNLLRRREPPFGRRGDPVLNPAAMYGMASSRISALMKRCPSCCFFPRLPPRLLETEAANGRSPPLVAGKGNGEWPLPAGYVKQENNVERDNGNLRQPTPYPAAMSRMFWRRGNPVSNPASGYMSFANDCRNDIKCAE